MHRTNPSDADFPTVISSLVIDHIKNPPPPFLCTKKVWAAGSGGEKVKEERWAMLPTLWDLGSLKSRYREAARPPLPSEVWEFQGESRGDTGWYTCYPHSLQLLSTFSQGPENSREPWTFLMPKALGLRLYLAFQAQLHTHFYMKKY